MRSISKHFGATRALDSVSCELNAGEVMALIGENGAGKSTLMKILSGAHRPDAGTMELDGRKFLAGNPQESRAAGVAMIYQELNLAADLSVEDNIMLGQEAGRWAGNPGESVVGRRAATCRNRPSAGDGCTADRLR